MEELERIINIHFQDIGNTFVPPFDAEDFWLISFPMTEIAGNIGIRQKLKLYFFISIAIAGRTGSFIRIETKVTHIEAKIFAVRSPCKKFPNMIKGSNKRSWTGSRSFSYARLVYIDDVFDIFVALDRIYRKVLVKFL